MLFHSYCTAVIAAFAAATLSSCIVSVVADSDIVENGLRGGGGGASVKNQHNHRVLQLQDEEFTFLIADVQYEDGFASTARNLQGNSNQGNGNQGNGELRPAHKQYIGLQDGTMYEIDGDSEDTHGFQSGTLVEVPPQSFFDHKTKKINLAGGKLVKKNKKKPPKKRDLQADDSSTEEQARNLAELRRHLAATNGETTVVAVMVNAIDGSYNGGTAADLYNHVFGMSDLSLKMGYEQCSHGKMTISPGGSSYGITNGVITINVSENVKQADGTTPNDAAIRNAVTAAINAQYGVTSPNKIADHIMLCLPSAAMAGIAYAYINHWMSVYSNTWCHSPSALMHEHGHNYGFAHSNEGSTAYADQSGMMGYSYGNLDGPIMCFNAAKSWQSGWFDDSKRTMNIGGTGPTDNCLDVEVTGQSDYVAATGQTVLVKMNRSSGTDLFLMYNKKTGINSGTVEGGNLVMVVEAGGEGTAYSESNLLAKLGAGASQTFPNYLNDGRDLVIRVLSINNGRAQMRIEFAGLCTGTMAPTPAPCPNQKQLSIQITTDSYPEETTWTVSKYGSCSGQTDPNISSPAYSTTGVQPAIEQCVDKGQYQFAINDTYGDGICCGYGSGSFKILYGGVEVLSGGEFGSSASGTFGTCETTPPPVNPPTSNPTKSPTPKPTPLPTNPPPPTNAPTPNPTLAPTNEPTPNPTTSPTPKPTPLPTNPPTPDPTSSPTFPPPTTSPTPNPTSPPTFVYKYVCSKTRPEDTTICTNGALAGGKCLTEGEESNCGTNKNPATCYWASSCTGREEPTCYLTGTACSSNSECCSNNCKRGKCL